MLQCFFVCAHNTGHFYTICTTDFQIIICFQNTTILGLTTFFKSDNCSVFSNVNIFRAFSDNILPVQSCPLAFGMLS